MMERAVPSIGILEVRWKVQVVKVSGDCLSLTFSHLASGSQQLAVQAFIRACLAEEPLKRLAQWVRFRRLSELDHRSPPERPQGYQQLQR